MPRTTWSDSAYTLSKFSVCFQRGEKTDNHRFDDGPVCLGWLRASHRELDATQSSPEQPVLAHRRELKLNAGEIYQLDVELWPSSMVYHPGEKLCLVIQGTDIYVRSKHHFVYLNTDLIIAAQEEYCKAGGIDKA